MLLFASNASALVVQPPPVQFCGQPMAVQLLAGQTNGVGTVTVQNDINGYLYVTYKTIPGVTISETHLA